MKVVLDGHRKGGFFRRLFRWLLFFALVGGSTGAFLGLIGYAILSREVPNFASIEDYRPKTVTRVFAQDGQLIGEYAREKRVVLPYARIPVQLKQAFLASEDNRFFDHSGIDYLGILRAVLVNLKAGRKKQGASTITQQVAKSLLISAEGYKKGAAKSFKRKIKEAILARRLEARLEKEEILELYLNQIFLGNQAYGVQAAAENYFRKNVEDLNLAEAALLGGLPQAPTRYSPFRYPQRAKERREYVLRRMLESGFITQAQLDEAKETPITVYPAGEPAKEVAPYFAEHVRRMIVDKYGEDRVLDDGLEVWTTVDVERYRGAEDSVYENLREVDKRQGYRGALAHLDGKKDVDTFLTAYNQELQRLGRYEKLEDGELYVGVITKVDTKDQLISLLIGPHRAYLPLAAMRWARKVNPNEWFESALLSSIPKTFQVGDVIHVRATTLKTIKKDRYATPFLKLVPDDPTLQLVALEQEPNLESALMSIEVESGYTLAMIGGYSFDRTEFNRAFQACRQPGSSFKPLVYASALDLKEWTASTIVQDSPITFDDPDNQKRWKPSNFETKFLGDVTLRTALQNSMNLPAIKVFQAVGLREGIEYFKKLGITTPIPPELGVAIGQACVTMSDLTGVYHTFSNYGAKVPQKFVTLVRDRDGRTLMDDAWSHDPWISIDRKVRRALDELDHPPEQIIDRQTGYLITKMMRNVVQGGTGTPAQRLGVPVAGKTGTTNDSFDAWFVGYTTEIVTAAWVGYDDYVLPMGRYEQGGRAALPVWLDYMKVAIKGRRTPEFAAPSGITFVLIDPKTGMRAKPDTIGAVVEAYREGAEPKEYVGEAGAARSDELGKVDMIPQ